MLPNNIDRYQIQEEIGRGGMATVLKAYDPRFQRDVAIKLLPREFLHDAQFRARFQREAQTIAALEHPAIVPVYDFGDADGQLFLVMRLMSGGSLADRLEKGPIPIAETARIFERLAPALDSAHSKGIIHRDLKPGNILFDEWSNPYLADFGIAKLIAGSSTALTATGGLVGTPAYMSPEQVRGVDKLDGRSDIYAMGVILFQMLTGKLPYNANTPIGLAFMHVNEPVPNILEANNTLPHAYQSVIGKAMAKDRNARPATTTTFSNTVSTLVSQDGTTTSGGIKTIVDPLPEPEETAPSSKANLLPILETEVLPESQGGYQAQPVSEALPRPLPQANSKSSRRLPAWGWAIVGIVLIGLIYGSTLLFKGNDTVSESSATATSPIMIAEAEATATLTKTPTPTNSPTIEKVAPPPATETSSPQPTATATAVPTKTPLPTNTPIPEPQVRVIYSSANVRNGPGSNYESIGTLTQNDAVKVIATNNDQSWYNIELKDGTLGWISASAVEEIQGMEIVTIAKTIPAVQITSIPIVSSDWAESCGESWRWSSDNSYPYFYPATYTTQNSTVYGEDPITFSWPACNLPSGYYYHVIILYTDMTHIGDGDRYTNSFDTTSNSIVIDLPNKMIGAWEWDVEVRGPSGDTATYVNPDNNRTLEVTGGASFFYAPYSTP